MTEQTATSQTQGRQLRQRFFLILASLACIPVTVLVVSEYYYRRSTVELRHYASLVEAAPNGNVRFSGNIASPDPCREAVLPDWSTQSGFNRKLADGCYERRVMSVVWWMALGSLLGSVSILGGIAVAGAVIRGNRDRLVLLFVVGRRVVTWLTVPLIITQGLLTAFVAVTLLHSGFLSFLILLGTLGAGLMLAGAASQAARPPTLSVLAFAVIERNEPRLWQLVRDVAGTIDVPLPDHLILTLRPDFFASGAALSVTNAPQPLHGETLCLSLPLMRLLSVPELSAVIGHELGHFKLNDINYNSRFAPVYQHMTTIVHQARMLKGVPGLALWPIYAILGFFIDQFTTAERAIARAREVEADQAGAAAAGASALASALIKAAVLAPLWHAHQNQLIELARLNRVLMNTNIVFGEIGAGGLRELRADTLAQLLRQHRMPHPIDSHPPTIERLEALDVRLDETIQTLRTPSEASVSILMDAERIERELTAVQTRMIGSALAASRTPPAPPAKKA